MSMKLSKIEIKFEEKMMKRVEESIEESIVAGNFEVELLKFGGFLKLKLMGFDVV